MTGLKARSVLTQPVVARAIASVPSNDPEPEASRAGVNRRFGAGDRA